MAPLSLPLPASSQRTSHATSVVARVPGAGFCLSLYAPILDYQKSAIRVPGRCSPRRNRRLQLANLINHKRRDQQAFAWSDCVKIDAERVPGDRRAGPPFEPAAAQRKQSTIKGAWSGNRSRLVNGKAFGMPDAPGTVVPQQVPGGVVLRGRHLGRFRPRAENRLSAHSGASGGAKDRAFSFLARESEVGCVNPLLFATKSPRVLRRPSARVAGCQ